MEVEPERAGGERSYRVATGRGWGAWEGAGLPASPAGQHSTGNRGRTGQNTRGVAHTTLDGGLTVQGQNPGSLA